WWVDEDEGRVRSPVFELDGVRVSNCSVWSKGMDWLVGGGVGVLLSGNTATWGFSIKLSNSHILHNTINSPMGSDAIGGGFGLLLNSTQLTDASSVAIIDCVVANNSAFAGTSSEEPLLARCQHCAHPIIMYIPPAVNDDGGGISYYYYGEGELRNASFLVDGYLATANFGTVTQPLHPFVTQRVFIVVFCCPQAGACALKWTGTFTLAPSPCATPSLQITRSWGVSVFVIGLCVPKPILCALCFPLTHSWERHLRELPPEHRGVVLLPPHQHHHCQQHRAARGRLRQRNRHLLCGCKWELHSVIHHKLL
ncbi:MAG: hypothetical protein P4L87_18215, partial [Formivibrio sp.]|nr:hypothetical protein [Formivibrio sp.]